jgi:hypothetical protein
MISKICWHILQIKTTFYVTLKLVATKILISQQPTMATSDGFNTHPKNTWWLQHCCYYGSMSKSMVVPSNGFNVHLLLLLHVQICHHTQPFSFCDVSFQACF